MNPRGFRAGFSLIIYRCAQIRHRGFDDGNGSGTGDALRPSKHDVPDSVVQDWVPSHTADRIHRSCWVSFNASEGSIKLVDLGDRLAPRLLVGRLRLGLAVWTIESGVSGCSESDVRLVGIAGTSCDAG